jgi:hypothetical protein
MEMRLGKAGRDRYGILLIQQEAVQAIAGSAQRMNGFLLNYKSGK